MRAQIGVMSPQAQSPPGVQFLGQSVQPVHQQAPGIVYLDNTQLPGLSHSGIASPTVRAITEAVGRNSAIPNSNLHISGINHKGELIITGPGGSITIGTDLLNGISRNNPVPFFTEFEEMELEGQNHTGGGMHSMNPNRVELSQHGKGTIIIERAPQIHSVTPVDPLQVGSAEAAASASSASSSASAGGASAASSAASSAGGAASSASASAGGVSSSSSSAVSLGNGISLENGGQVIRLGQNGGKTQTITLGGANGQIQLGDGGSGIQVPGNATFIVGG